jgi:hypothetical protein
LIFTKIFDTENDGFLTAKFHEICDNKRNLLIFIENSENERFGGFTSLSFDIKLNNYKTGGFNFIFSIDKNKIYNQT